MRTRSATGSSRCSTIQVSVAPVGRLLEVGDDVVRHRQLVGDAQGVVRRAAGRVVVDRDVGHGAIMPLRPASRRTWRPGVVASASWVMSDVEGFDHLVLVCAEVERTLAWYLDELGLEPVRVEEWRRGEVFFPSVRVSAETIIDLIPGTVSGRNVDHLCLVVDQAQRRPRGVVGPVHGGRRPGPAVRGAGHGDERVRHRSRRHHRGAARLPDALTRPPAHASRERAARAEQDGQHQRDRAHHHQAP